MTSSDLKFVNQTLAPYVPKVEWPVIEVGAFKSDHCVSAPPLLHVHNKSWIGGFAGTWAVILPVVFEKVSKRASASYQSIQVYSMKPQPKTAWFAVGTPLQTLPHDAFHFWALSPVVRARKRPAPTRERHMHLGSLCLLPIEVAKESPVDLFQLST